ncbi:hypothetical protein, partial [uncultured Escherichia sp.]|uniref:hypothetical protein n=1 Tax=uncultured Escherichia sp. TaxID=237777 RepID=UPI00225256A0
IKNDGHYFCRAGGNRPDGLNEPVTFVMKLTEFAVSGAIRMVHQFQSALRIYLLLLESCQKQQQ